MKNRSLITTLFAVFYFCPIPSKADRSIDPGDYILLKIPSKSEPLSVSDIGVMPARIFRRTEKLFLYFENTIGPKISAVDDEGRDQDLTGGFFEIIAGTSRGDILMFKSVKGSKQQTKEPNYLGSVYRGSNWGSGYRGVFVDRHNEPDGQGLFLLIPTDLTVDVPEYPDTTGGEKD